MIIVRLMGGIGNQMFQYAAGRRAAISNGVQLKMDASSFESNPRRGYALAAFKIRAKIASAGESRRLKEGTGILGRLLCLSGTQGSRNAPTYVKERHFQFHPEVMTVSDKTYLDGYWQSERYFKDVEGVIRNELTIMPVPDPLSERLLQEIVSQDSIGVHVRRGDYVTDQNINSFHGVCPVEYYRAATALLTKASPKAHVYVFSDDPGWVRDNIKFDCATTYVTHNGPDKGYEDMRLISACKHQVISNSTFSWWGAWMNGNKDKVVVAPRRWFNDDAINTEDLLPEGWITV